MAGIALVVGVGGVFLLFWAMDRVVNSLPTRWRESARPYVFVGPAMVIVAIFLVYPVVNTIILSFKDARSENWVGFDNYQLHLQRQQHVAVDAQHARLDRGRPGPLGQRRPGLRHPGRPAAAG